MALKAVIIDSDASTTDLLGILLRSHRIQVFSSNSSPEGIELTRLEKPDIIILDLMMSGDTGWEVCKTLRSFTNAPIAILSALDAPSLISEALDAGADDYMIKPITSRVLMAHINNLTRRYAVENNKSTMIRQFNLPKIKTDDLYKKQKPLQP